MEERNIAEDTEEFEQTNDLSDFEDNDSDDELYEHHRIIVDPKQELERIDKFLMNRLARTTRNRVQNAIKAGYVLVNDSHIKSNYKVRPLDVVTVHLPDPVRDTGEILPEDIPLDIVYEDEDLLIVNKPTGLVVHPATENWTGTLANALAFHFQKQGLVFPGLVHRIDKNTTGLLVVAKHEYAKNFLSKQFFAHSIERTYNALVWGEPMPESGVIRGHIARGLKDRRIMSVYPDGERGKHAVTHYKVLRTLRYISLVQCNLETGRTHQIRAHFKHLGHPLFGDPMYGGKRIVKGSVYSKYRAFVENCFTILPRQALHAKSLGFIHPRTEQFIHFDSTLPDDFLQVIEKWERYVRV
ncbi:MAG: RluA family pseudouridine synthase [Bernardetiaceae bacterium]|nr:RluA family pseudouridine synthase [Bernardetiaceae bacterium]